jgi:1-acyl-sn-glycerol-3-phosphate acyltransferase
MPLCASVPPCPARGGAFGHVCACPINFFTEVLLRKPITPDLGIVYPENPFEHVLEPLHLRDIKIDADYPFLDKSFSYRFMRGLVYLAVFVLVFIISPIRFGLKIEGRKILRKYRTLLKNGAMSVSNHINRWDFLFVLQALRYRSMYLPVWKENLRGKDIHFIRLIGGIPIPEDIHAIKQFNQAFDEIRAKKKWIHAYPETAMWPYYRPIRPFMKGVFTMAYRYKLPVVPLAFFFSKPRFPFTLVNLFRKKKLPMITVRIGEPLLPDTELPRKEVVLKLRKECHEAIVRLAEVGDNPWSAEGD